MYDKHGCVLRVETVINDPYEFKNRRRAGRRRRRTLGWHPLPKGVAFLPRYATVSAAANHRYLDALAVVDDPAPAHRALDRLVQPIRDRHGRSFRAFNPATAPDVAVFAAVLRGEHTLQGFRNREVRTRLFGPPPLPPIAGGARRPHASSNGSTSVAWSRRFPARVAGGSHNSGMPS
jgi:hypothetical protein